MRRWWTHSFSLLSLVMIIIKGGKVIGIRSSQQPKWSLSQCPSAVSLLFLLLMLSILQCSNYYLHAYPMKMHQQQQQQQYFPKNSKIPIGFTPRFSLKIEQFSEENEHQFIVIDEGNTRMIHSHLVDIWLKVKKSSATATTTVGHDSHWPSWWDHRAHSKKEKQFKPKNQNQCLQQKTGNEIVHCQANS